MRDGYKYPFSDIRDEEVWNSKQNIREDVSCYNNGHSCYIITGFKEKDVMETYLAIWSFYGRTELFNVEFEKHDNNVWSVSFDTCEKYVEFAEEVAQAWPETTVYAWDCWQNIYLNIYKNGALVPAENRNQYADFALDTAFEDYGNLRLDVEVTDKATGASFCYGDLLCLDNLADAENIEKDDVYKELTMFLTSKEDKSTLDFNRQACIDYHNEKELEEGER